MAGTDKLACRYEQVRDGSATTPDGMYVDVRTAIQVDFARLLNIIPLQPNGDPDLVSGLMSTSTRGSAHASPQIIRFLTGTVSRTLPGGLWVPRHSFSRSASNIESSDCCDRCWSRWRNQIQFRRRHMRPNECPLMAVSGRSYSTNLLWSNGRYRRKQAFGLVEVATPKPPSVEIRLVCRRTTQREPLASSGLSG